MRLIDILKYSDVARVNVNRLLQPMSIILSGMTFLKVYGINLHVYYTIIFFIFFIIGLIIFGYFYVELGFYEKEIDFDIKNNKVLRNLK